MEELYEDKDIKAECKMMEECVESYNKTKLTLFHKDAPWIPCLFWL